MLYIYIHIYIFSHIGSTAQKVKSWIKEFFSKCDQIRSFL